MARTDLSALFESASVQELKSLIVARENYDRLLKKKIALEKDLAIINREINNLLVPLGKSTRTRAPAAGKSTPRKRIAQPSIQSLIIDTLREKHRPLSVNEIADALLQEKKYRTKSGNFKNQLRVLLYRNQKGLFRKTDAGTFTLAEAPATPPVQTAALAKNTDRSAIGDKGISEGKKPATAKRPPGGKKTTDKKRSNPRSKPAAK